MGIEKILRSPEWASKYFFAKIFAAAAASFVNLHYPYELQLNLHNLHINSILKYIKYLTPGVGIEKLSRVVEWAAKIFYRATSGPQNIFL